MTDQPETTVELLSADLVSRGRRTGVIVGVPLDITMSAAIHVREQLAERFPEVRFAVVPGVSSIAFEWDDPDEEPAP